MSNTDASFARPALKSYTAPQLRLIDASISKPANKVLKVIRHIAKNKHAEIDDLTPEQCHKALFPILAIPKIHETHRAKRL